MININPAKEPDIFEAVMHKDDYLNHGVIVENAMIYPMENLILMTKDLHQTQELRIL